MVTFVVVFLHMHCMYVGVLCRLWYHRMDGWTTATVKVPFDLPSYAFNFLFLTENLLYFVMLCYIYYTESS